MIFGNHRPPTLLDALHRTATAAPHLDNMANSLCDSTELVARIYAPSLVAAVAGVKIGRCLMASQRFDRASVRRDPAAGSETPSPPLYARKYLPDRGLSLKEALDVLFLPPILNRTSADSAGSPRKPGQTCPTLVGVLGRVLARR